MLSVPKGGVEKGETSGQAAAREAFEEAGIPSNIPPEAVSPKILQLDIPSKSTPKAAIWHVHVVTLDSENDLLPDWDEKEERERAWYTPKDVLRGLREWGGSGNVTATDEEGDAGFERGGRKKKAIKGDAMELALNAFADRYGWDRKYEAVDINDRI